MFFLINDNRPTDSVNKKYSDKNQSHKNSYVAILTREEWEKQKHDFDLGIDIAQRDSENSITKAEVNYDSITGTFLSQTEMIFRNQMHILHLLLMSEELFLSMMAIQQKEL